MDDMKQGQVGEVEQLGATTFRERLLAACRVARLPTGGSPNLGYLATSLGLSASEFSLRLNGKRERSFSRLQVQAIVRQLVEWGGLQTTAQAAELLTLGGVAPFSDDAWQQPPLNRLLNVAVSEEAAQTISPTADLPAFRRRLRELYRQASPYDARSPTQRDLAAAIGLADKELSRRLHGKGQLTTQDDHAIVRTLTEWGAIQSRYQAEELLQLLAAPNFSLADWASPPLDALTQLPIATAAKALNLPQPRNSFVGRTAAIVTCTRLLRQVRLLTIVGPGGVGKTRLAIELTRRQTADYPAGSCFVELAPLQSGEFLPQLVARSLGLREQPGQSIVATLHQHLAERLLLVLDNCEHLRAAVGELVADLLDACPNLTILATSRSDLGLAGEQLYPVAPLTLPTSQSSATASEAVSLLIQRVQAYQPNFSLEQQSEAVVELCRLLDGIPLAIELAAPWLQVLTAAQLTQRLRGQLSLLTAEHRYLPDRQRTMQASIAWSYDLLAATEQRLLRRLAIFSGGWDLEAAEVVCTDGELSSTAVLPSLRRLIAQSLVEVQISSNGETMRHRLLEPLREFALAELTAAGEQSSLAARHATLYLQLAEAAAPHLSGPQAERWQARLTNEYSNLRTALAWSVQHDDGATALRIGVAIWRLWIRQGTFSEGRYWLGAALQAAGEGAPQRAAALLTLGGLALAHGDGAAATVWLNESLALARKQGDRPTALAANLSLGDAAFYGGELDLAASYYQTALSLSQLLGEVQKRPVILEGLANLHIKQHGYDDGEAVALYHEAAALVREQGARPALVNLLTNLADAAYDQSDLASAAAHTAEALAIARQLGSKPQIGDLLTRQALIATAQGEAAAGAAAALASLDILQAVGQGRMVAFALMCLSYAVNGLNQPAAAARLSGAAAQRREASGLQLPPAKQSLYERIVASLQATLGMTRYLALTAEGAAMSEAEAVQYAQSLAPVLTAPLLVS